MKALLWLLRAELLDLLRTREAYSYGILPALLGFPTVALAATIWLSMLPDPVLALPVHDPAGLSLDVEDWGYDVRRVDDPEALVVSGEAEAAVVSWSAAPGSTGPWLTAELLTDEDGTAKNLEAWLRQAVSDAQDELIVQHGGKGLEDRVVAVARVRSAPPEIPLGMLLWSVWLVAAYLICFLLPVRTAEDRERGYLEALAVTRTPLWQAGLARALVTSLYAVLVVSLMPLGFVVLVGLPLPLHALDVLEASLILLIWAIASVAIGVVASSGRTALYIGSYALILACPLPMVSLLFDLYQVPLAGLGEPGPLGWQLVRIVATGVLCALALAALQWLGRGERVLAVGGAE